jgi:hypothetical protein
MGFAAITDMRKVGQAMGYSGFSMCKLEIFIPATHLEPLRETLRAM